MGNKIESVERSSNQPLDCGLATEEAREYLRVECFIKFPVNHL